jgi:NAD(P)H dehydrogenase (quinone)
MSALIVFAHPLRDSLGRRFADAAAAALSAAHEVELLDLYDRNFDPRMPSTERATYYAENHDTSAVADHAAALLRADVLVFVFPTWWFGPPAILKGWIDRVFAPGIAFEHGKDFGPIVPGLERLRHAAVITTLGTPWWVDRIGMRRPVRRIFRTAVVGGCAPAASFSYLPFYSAERPEPQRIEAFERRIRAELSRFR